ncbi:MAG: glycoside hydrolase family 3 protein [Caldilineaceae bacterium]
MPANPKNDLSRRRFLLLGGQSIIGMALITSCAPAIIPTENPLPAPTTTSFTPMPTTPILPKPTPTTNPPTPQPLDINLMIGQMVMAGFRGIRAADAPTILADIEQRQLGNIVYFEYDVPSQNPVRNVASPAQLKQLSADLQAASATPLLIAIDQEGGIVNRLKEKYGFPTSVTAQYLGQQDDLAITRQYATATAKALVAAGINLNLAPVVDLNINPQSPAIGYYERSFGADPDLVTRHALEVIRAHHEQGVLCTLKHFPGHGSASTDSHLDLVDVTKTWQEAELEPYRNLLAAGEVDAILTAHVFSPLDPENPATLSKATITDVLRGQMGYEGVVITDDMGMGAIVKNYGLASAIERAINAGVDIIAIGNNGYLYIDNIVEQVVTAIQQMVAEGKISPEQIEQSYTRIQRLKARIGKVPANR